MTQDKIIFDALTYRETMHALVREWYENIGSDFLEAHTVDMILRFADIGAASALEIQSGLRELVY